MKSILYNMVSLMAIAMLTIAPNIVKAADATTTAEDAWQRGLEAYSEHDYATAVESFENVIAYGHASADAYYNLAGAYFKLGQEASHNGGRQFSNGELGKAILNYHRAIQLDPEMEDAHYNLAIAVDHTNDTQAIPESFITSLWMGISNLFASNTWAWGSIILLGLALALFMAYRLSTRLGLRKGMFWLSIVCMLGFILTTLFAITERSLQQRDNRAVVICNDTTPVHASPDNTSKIIRQPSQGVTVVELRNHNEWSEILFADGEKGWIRSSNLEII